MTKDEQSRFASVIARLSALYPEWRIGQIVANVAWWSRGPTNEAIWEIEDEEFLAAAEAHLAERQADIASQPPQNRPVSRVS